MPILRDSKGDIIPFIFSQYLFYKSVKTIYLHANYRDCVWIKIFKIIIIYWKYNLRFIFYHFTVRIPNSFFAKWSIQVFVIIGIKFNFEKNFAVRYGRTSGGPSGPDKSVGNGTNRLKYCKDGYSEIDWRDWKNPANYRNVEGNGQNARDRKRDRTR